MERLVDDDRLRRTLGEAGRQYTERYYRWPSIIDRYTRFLGRRGGPGPLVGRQG